MVSCGTNLVHIPLIPYLLSTVGTDISPGHPLQPLYADLDYRRHLCEATGMRDDYQSLFVPCNCIYLLDHSVGSQSFSTHQARLDEFHYHRESAEKELWPA